ncbi:MAG TPA: hypothetical protein VI776_11750 [Anaerolineales bacterium]|nr:hypothetical protein [Anaerolineales bacterium]
MPIKAWSKTETTMIKPLITFVQNPVSPAATIPALMEPMMNEATKVPKTVPVQVDAHQSSAI